jgi:hypothetical protein
MVTRTLLPVAIVCDKWNARIEDLSSSTSLILGVDLGCKPCNQMIVNLPRKFQFEYENSLFVFTSYRCLRGENSFMKIGRVAEKESIIGRRNDVEKFLDS